MQLSASTSRGMPRTWSGPWLRDLWAVWALMWLTTHHTAQALTMDLRWQAGEATGNDTMVGPGTVLRNATVRLTPTGPWLAYWDNLAVGATLTVSKATVLTSCNVLDGIRSFSSAADKQVLPAPAVWITSLLVSLNLTTGAAYISISDTVFACQPTTPSCRADPSASPSAADPVLVNSGWQFVAVLSQLALTSSADSNCQPPLQYTINLARDISLQALRYQFSTRANPVPPYYITSNVTIQPQPGLASAVLDLAEAWNLTSLSNNNYFVFRDLTLVNLATAPPFAMAFPLWAVKLPARGTFNAKPPQLQPIQLYNCTLVVPSDEFNALAVFAPLYTATTSAANSLASWLKFAVTSIDKFTQLDSKTIFFQGFLGLGEYMTDVTLSCKPLPGFPLMHNESGIGRIMDNVLESYPWVIMIDNETMLLEFTREQRVREAVNIMVALNYSSAANARVVLALTQSFNLTPSLWRNATGSLRSLSSSLTISAWPQSMPITVGMANTANLITINDGSAATVSFRDLILADLPVVQQWQPSLSGADTNLALQGGIHSVGFDRSAQRLSLVRTQVMVSREELKLRTLCANQTATAADAALMQQCLTAKLYLPISLEPTATELYLPPPNASQPMLTGLGTQLLGVTFSAMHAATVAPRQDLAGLINVWQGLPSALQYPPTTVRLLSSPPPPPLVPITPSSGDSGGGRGGVNPLWPVIGGLVGFIVLKTTLIVCLCRRRAQEGKGFNIMLGKVRLGWDKPTSGNAGSSAPTSGFSTEDTSNPGGLEAVNGMSLLLAHTSPSMAHTHGARLRSRLHERDSGDVAMGRHVDEAGRVVPPEVVERLVQQRREHSQEVHDIQKVIDGAGGKLLNDGEVDVHVPGKGRGVSPASSGRAEKIASGRFRDGSGIEIPTPKGSGRRGSTAKTQLDMLTNSSSRSSAGTGSARTRRPSLVSELAALTQDMEARISDQLLEICDVIGSGGYSTVYRGLWQGLPVAVKTVIFARAGDNKTMALQEAAISKSINHPHIVTTYCYDLEPIGLGAGSGHLGGGLQVVGRQVADNPGPQGHGHHFIGNEWRLYLVMEYMDQSSLKEVIRNQLLMLEGGVPDMVAILELAWQVAQGMLHLHSKQIIHGDLKPENVLLKTHDAAPLGVVAKVADFGLSVTMSDIQSHVSNWYRGTPFYVSPEVCASRRMSKASDVFSYGVMLWEMYHSLLVWRHAADGKELEVHPAFPRFPPSAPREYVLLSHACIQEDPIKRPTFDQITMQLRQISLGLHVKSPSPPVATSPESAITHAISTIAEQPAQETDAVRAASPTDPPPHRVVQVAVGIRADSPAGPVTDATTMHSATTETTSGVSAGLLRGGDSGAELPQSAAGVVDHQLSASTPSPAPSQHVVDMGRTGAGGGGGRGQVGVVDGTLSAGTSGNVDDGWGMMLPLPPRRQ